MLRAILALVSVFAFCAPAYAEDFPFGGRWLDRDRDGYYEAAYLWDADGDGSAIVTCTAKDSPDPACKAAGERIYRDLSDDLNCAVHGCGFGQMEFNGTLYLESGVVYVYWPCWDASEPSGFNDPTATDESLHDQTSDTAYGHCPLSPDGRRLAAIAFMGWQGELIGGGTDTRNPATTDSYLRNKGTYIVDDRGPAWLTGSGGNEDDNSWFGIPSFVRGITMGYYSRAVVAAGITSESGEYSSDGDSPGSMLVSGNQTFSGMDAAICVCEDIACGASSDNIAQTLVAGDVVEITASSQTSTFNSANVVYAMRVRDVPTGAECNGAGTTEIPLGGRVTSGTSQVNFGMDVPFATQVTANQPVVIPRSDWLSSSVRITQITFEPQDYWNEPGGDCAGSGVWSFSLDAAENDFDCDTNSLFGVFGAGNQVIEDIVVRHWHSYAFDGHSSTGNPWINRVLFLYGNGGQIADFGSGWNFRDIEVRDSQFSLAVSATFGPGVTWKGVKVYNSSFPVFSTMNNWSAYNTFEDVTIYGSSYAHLFNFTCGARHNVFRHITTSGQYGREGNQIQGFLFRFGCANTADPIRFNVIEDVRVSGSGDAFFASDESMAVLAFDTNAVIGTSNAAAIKNNRFVGFNYQFLESGATHEACLFAVQDDENSASRDTGPDYSLEDVFELNTFVGNSVVNDGSGSEMVYCICGLYDSGGNKAANICDDSIVGSGGGGADPRGCLNLEDGSAPTNESCT